MLLDRAADLMAAGHPVAAERWSREDAPTVSAHAHPYLEIYYLEAGRRWHTSEGRTYELEPGQVISYPPHTWHRSHAPSGVGYRRVVVYVDPVTLEHLEPAAPLLTEVRTYAPRGRGRHTVESVLSDLLSCQEEPGPLQRELLQVHAQHLILTLLQDPPHTALVQRQERMSEVQSYLHEHLDEPVTLDELAHRFFVSPYHLSREFKRHTGSTIITYVTALRVARAERLLAETDLSITSISKQVGFANVTHFNRVFKATHGTTPSDVRHAQPIDTTPGH